MASPLARPRIEIRSALAVNPDHDGRPRRILVLGVADTAERRLLVRFPEHDADAAARFVDPQRTHTYGVQRRFARDALVGIEREAETHVWLAEFDVGSYPGLGMLRGGTQSSPIAVRASYFGESEADGAETKREFAALPIEPGFDVGVLLVHGIGVQRTAETITEWSSALKRWISGWFAAGAANLGARFELDALHQWETTIRVPVAWWATDGAYLERCQLARSLVAQAEAHSPERAREALIRWAEGVSRDGLQGQPTLEDRAGRESIIRRNRDEVGASALAGRASFTAASLLDPGRSPNEPANAELLVESIAADGYVLRSRWLLAEAHWAEAFRAPTLGAFAQWAVQAGPIAFCYFFGTQVRRSKRPWFASVPWLVAFAAIVLILQLALLVLMVIAAIPIPWLRKWLARVERAMTGVLGDSYVFATDDLQRRAILERVRRDLRWLLARCRKVVLVAHSQGAAVAYHALDGAIEGDARGLDSVVTLGSGFRILEFLAKSLNSPPVLRAGWAAIAGVALLAAGAWSIGSVGGAVGGGLVAAGLVALVYGGVKAAELLAGEPFMPQMGRQKRWLDFYGAHDPVPFGPFAASESRFYKPQRVHNRNSLFTDHNAYWENADEFVGPLARRLADVAGFRPISAFLPDDDDAMRRAFVARKSRVQVLAVTRWLVTACALTLLAAQFGNLFDVTAWVGGWLLHRLGFTATAPALPDTSVWVPVLLPLTPVLAYLAVIAPLWKMWGERELAAVLRREQTALPVMWVTLFVVALTGVVAASAFLFLGTHAAALAVGWLAASALATAALCTMHRERLVAT
jgi:hypothetical protein